MSTHGIHKLKLMFRAPAVTLVLEKEIDPFLLHQPADKIEIRFAVLHAMIHLAVTACERGRVIVETVILEHFLQDAGNGHFVGRFGHGTVKDSAIGGARQKPKPGHDSRLIAVETVGPGTLHEGAKVTAEVSLFRLTGDIGHIPADGRGFSDELEKIHRWLFTQQVNFDDERTPKLFREGHRFEEQLIFAKLGIDGNRTVILGDGGHIRKSGQPSLSVECKTEIAIVGSDVHAADI